MTVFDDLYDYLTSDMQSDEQEDSWIAPVYEWCRCAEPIYLVYVDNIPGWLCRRCKGIIREHEDCAGDAK